LSDTFKSLFWSAIESFTTQFLQVVFGIFLARILGPKTFGIYGMLAIFIALANTLVNSGLTNALIQKTDRTEDDFSTVFIFNLFVSIFLYSILFLFKNAISNYFSEDILAELLPVIAIVVILKSFDIVGRTKLIIALNFRAIALINLTASFVSGSVAIVLAINDYGIWALVWQQVLLAMVSIALIFFYVDSYVVPKFYYSSFKQMFRFSSNLLVSNLLSTGMANIYNVLLGKNYGLSGLGYYTRARNFSEISSIVIGQFLQKVAFPKLSALQHDKIAYKTAHQRFIKAGYFFTFPAMLLLYLLAEPIVMLLLGNEWVKTIDLLRILALARITMPLSLLNLTALNSFGRSDVFLKLDVISIIFGISILMFTIRHGILMVVYGQLALSLISYFFNAWVAGKHANYLLGEQLKDSLPYILASLALLLSGLFLIQIECGYLLKMLLVVVGSLSPYLLVCYLLKTKELEYLTQFFNRSSATSKS
jgi:teichuronic acid exporter